MKGAHRVCTLIRANPFSSVVDFVHFVYFVVSSALPTLSTLNFFLKVRVPRSPRK
jgi:hypothetical protein